MSKLQTEYECKRTVLSFSDNISQLVTLSRILMCYSDSNNRDVHRITYEVDAMHAEVIVKHFFLECAKPLTSPYAKDDDPVVVGEEERQRF